MAIAVGVFVCLLSACGGDGLGLVSDLLSDCERRPLTGVGIVFAGMVAENRKAGRRVA